MERDHQCDARRGCSGIAITGVTDTAEQSVIHAFFADVSSAVKIRGWAEQAEIVERLHYGYFALAASRINRGRNDHKCVVDVDNVRPLRIEQHGKIAARLRRPNHARDNGDSRESRSVL